MKRILFLVSNLDCGGVQKSFVNLINAMDRKRYEIDVFLFVHGGAFMRFMPADVNLIRSDYTEYLFYYFPKSIKALISHGYYGLAVKRLFQFLVSRFSRSYGGFLMSRMIKPLDKYYDVAIDEGGQALLYYMVDKVNADKRYSFFHSDYAQWDYYYRMDKKYYPLIDGVLTISEQCVNSIKKYFPFVSDKTYLMENISSVDFIKSLSLDVVSDIPFSRDHRILMTLGRLCEEKGVDLALDVAKKLKNKGLKYRWYFIGDGPKRALYEKKAHSLGLDDEVFFLGMRINPYAYIKLANLIVHPSLYEGKSIALDEVKILCKPLVITNFSTVKDQFEDRVNASICDFTVESISDAIVELLDNESLRNTYIRNLRNNIYDNTDQVNVLYDLIDK